MQRCQRTDLYGLICSVCAVRKYVAKGSLAAVDTGLQELMRCAGRMRSVSVKCCFLRWKDVQRYDFTDLGVGRAGRHVGSLETEKVL